MAVHEDARRMKAADIHFLVVEDHDFQRELLVCMLAAIGATHIVEAADGCAALEVLRGRTRPIDVIISDLEMPAMDGMEFIRHVGEAGLPVAMILISAHGRSLLASVGTMTEAYGVHLLGTVEKPVTEQKLEALITLHEFPAIPIPKSESVSFSEEDIIAALAARLFKAVF